jgi:hypothetical protein
MRAVLFSSSLPHLAEISRLTQCYNYSDRREVMAKSRDARKDVKKKPAKSIKEKRRAKLEKKSRLVSFHPSQ